MTISLFMDEDSLHKSILRALRQASFDCLTVTEAGRTGLSDADQLNYCTSVGRTIFTRNTGDFSALHAEWISTARVHSGIIVVTPRLVDAGSVLRAMTRIADTFDAEAIRGQLVHLRNYSD